MITAHLFHYFNSQPHKEADDKAQQSYNDAVSFQLTASQGGWLVSVRRGFTASNFNSQPHKEADGLSQLDHWQGNRFQLTASQGGWLILASSSPILAGISTHSLTRRLTRNDIFIKTKNWISTHSLTRRLTDLTPVEHKKKRSISTHSLTRRLTWWSSQGLSQRYFNSQPHKEADYNQSPESYLFYYFNSQPHKEADDMHAALEYAQKVFQLTASQGGWRIRNLRMMSLQISTHSLTRRLTAYTLSKFCNSWHFNSQPHKEADNEYGGSVEREVISTHSLTRRLTGLCDLLLNWYNHFNSQPHKEADPEALTPATPPRRFQLTASQGGWRLPEPVLIIH